MFENVSLEERKMKKVLLFLMVIVLSVSMIFVSCDEEELPKGDDGVGISSIEKTSSEGLVDTYTITLTDGSKSTFTVTNGMAKLWGLGSGNTYYIKETNPPAAEGYGLADGMLAALGVLV